MTATTISFSAGVATAAGSENGEMRLYKSGGDERQSQRRARPSAADDGHPGRRPATKFVLDRLDPDAARGGSVNLTTTAQDIYGNTATSYTGSHNSPSPAPAPSPGGTAPTVATAPAPRPPSAPQRALTFTNGVATVSSSKNGVMKLYRAEATTITVTDGIDLEPPAADRHGRARGDLEIHASASNRRRR